MADAPALPTELHELDFCYLTTIGRRSGREHTIEIWFGCPVDGSRLYLLAGGGETSDWVRNLRADPSVRVRVGARHWSARATVVDDVAERSRAAAIVFEKYRPRYDGDLTGWRSSALPVALDLVDDLGAPVEPRA